MDNIFKYLPNSDDDETVTIYGFDPEKLQFCLEIGENFEIFQLPEEIEGKWVTKIGDNAFKNCKFFKTVIIPHGVTEIGSGAFENCTELERVVIPTSVKEIGAGAFKGCTSLTNIAIPNSVTKIQYSAFNKTPWLSNKRKADPFVVINGILIDIEDVDLKECSGSVNIPNTVTKIGDRLFCNNDSLVSVNIPDGVTEIGNLAFHKCKSLKSVTISDSVTTIGKAFNNCVSLEDLTLPSYITKWCDCPFSGCNCTITYKGIPYYPGKSGEYLELWHAIHNIPYDPKAIDY